MKYISPLLALSALSYSLASMAGNPYADLRDELNATVKSKQSLIQPQIVGGQSASVAEYPFMSVLVFVSSQITTSLTVAGQSIDSDGFSFGVAGNATATVVDCGLGGETCTGVQGNICLIERGEFNFSEKALNCEAGGGIGAIIYNNVEGEISGTLGDDFTGTIPVVAVTQADGQAIAALNAPVATLTVTTGGLTQSSSCGATLIGDKWVLTAAHCVDSPSAEFLKVNVGEYDLSDGADQARDIAHIYSHPNYNDETFEYDVAVIELTETVSTPTVGLADESLTNQLAIENSLATVIGWGGTTGYAPGEGPTSGYPDVLREVDLNLYTNSQCADILANSQGISASSAGITDRMICAAVEAGGRSSCQGDSGGPLLVSTNSGFLQVGVVSWGIGCAAQGYPGVFARVSTLKDFIDSVTSGVTLSGAADLGALPVGAPYQASFTVTNNSNSLVVPSFTSDNLSNFSVNGDNCAQLSAGQSCELHVQFESSTAGDKAATIAVSTDVAGIATNSVNVTATAVAQSANLAGIAGDASNSVTWFSGGDRPWVENTVDGGVQSGDIGNRQDSILIARIEGSGTLSFQWSVSSEENTDEPDEPYDALYLTINGELQDVISGEQSFSAQTFQLTESLNLIEWRYSKDINTSEGEDKAYVRMVTFDADPVALPTPPPESSGSSGGSVFWLLLLALPAAVRKALKRA